MTAVTLRPDAPGRSGSFDATATGAATYWQCTSDNSDSTYVAMGTGPGATFLVSLGTVAMAAGSVTKSVTVRMRGNITGVSSGALSARLHRGDDTLLAYASTTFIAGPSAITTYSGAATAVTLTQADIDALYITYVHTFEAGRVHEMYVDLVYAERPTVSVTAPTGAQGTPTPTVLWTYTPGSDGDVQSRYQVRVFTAAEYGIVGFDPATSPASYDSGIVLGAATSAVSDVLANGTTYRAYVNVAQTINGTPQWSGWSYSAFTTSFTTSDILDVFASGDASLARHAIVVTRDPGTPTWITLELQRSDDAGATWVYVRGVNGFTLPGTGPQNFEDYESSNNVTAVFRARATYVASGVTITGPWLESNSVAWSTAADWLKDLADPARNRVVTIEANPSLARPRTQGVNTVVGRSDPVVLSDVRGLTRGTIVFVTLDDAAAVDLLSLTETDVLLLQTRPGARFGQKYVAIGGIDELPVVATYNEATRRWSVPFVEVVKPPIVAGP